MPWKSKAQAYMHTHHPEIVKKWDEHTPKGTKLPEHVKTAAMPPETVGAIAGLLARAGSGAAFGALTGGLTSPKGQGWEGAGRGALGGAAGGLLLPGRAGGPLGGIAGGYLARKKEPAPAAKVACIKLASAIVALPMQTRVKLAAAVAVQKRAALGCSKSAPRRGASMSKIQFKVATHLQKEAFAMAAVLPWLGGTAMKALPWIGSGAAMAAGQYGVESLINKFKKPQPQPQPQPQEMPGAVPQ